MQNAYETYDRIKAPGQITRIGAVITAAWVIIAAPVVFKPLSIVKLLPYALGHKEGFFTLQLISYSFIHMSVLHLAVDLAWFWALLNILKHQLSTPGFIRIFSLGTLGSGAILKALFWFFAQEGQVVGAFWAILSMLGALTLTYPERVRLFPPKKILIFGLITLIFLDQGFSNSNRFKMPELNWLIFSFLAWNGPTMILAMRSIRPIWIVLAWLVIDAMFFCIGIWDWSFLGIKLNMRLDFFLAGLAGLGAGILYGLGEKIWKRYSVQAVPI